jgi:propanol-preferring alcohol dehydrogenase
VRALRLEAPGLLTQAPLKTVELPSPVPAEDELLLDVSACGVCRTDLQLVTGALPLRRAPVIPGHQIVGRVREVGSRVMGWREGDRAGVGWLASTCGQCAACAAGAENLCSKATFTGWDRDGGFATQACVRASFAFRLPDGFADLDAAPLLCGGIIGYRSLKRSRVQPGQRLGLFGFGASASLAIQVARSWGCRVFVATRSASEQAAARALGAEWTGTYDEPPPEPLEAAISFAPAPEVVVKALHALERGGTLAINAIHLDGPLTFSYDRLWWERNVVSVANYTRDDARELLELAPRIPLVMRRDTFALEDGNLALARLEQGAIHGAAVLVS